MPNPSSPLKYIKQSSKTILFEKFTDNVDLYTLIRNEDIKEKEAFRQKVEQNLEVRSFEEFKEKFMPSVWEWTTATNNPEMPVEFNYSMKKPDDVPNANEIKLDKNEFYAMIMRLYTNKGTSGESTFKSNYSDVAELLSPKKVLEKAMQFRKDLEYNYNKMLTLGEGAKQEKNKCIKNINEIRREIISQYKNSFTGVLKLALADTQRKLDRLALENNDNSSGDPNGNKPTKQDYCKISFTPDGMLDIQIIEMPDNQEEDIQMIEMQDNQTEVRQSDDHSPSLIEIVEKDYDLYGDKSSQFTKSLVSSTYCNSTDIVKMSEAELVEKRNVYTSLYQNAQEHFIRAISSAVEKILNVKTYFEHATLDNKKLPSSLIVSNCKIEKLLEADVKSKFEFYLKECSRELDVNRIWFAIIPAIGDSDFIDNMNTDDDISSPEDLFNDAKNIRTTDGDELTSFSTLKSALEIMKNMRITTFFNFRANETTGFAKFSGDIIEKYKNKLEPVNGNKYAVFCYPNFTVLPKRETYIEIGKTGPLSNERTEFIDIPGIYIDSSYVAAGLVAASQNPAYLEKKFSPEKVLSDYPCVRFDFERKENKLIMLTKMNCEYEGRWSSEVDDKLSRTRFGFCFCCDTKHYNNVKVINSYVYSSRNMYTDNNNEYERICERLTMDFIAQFQKVKFPSATGDLINVSDAEEFLKSDVSEWRRNGSEEYVNNILISSGDFTEDIKREDGYLVIKFLDKETVMPIEVRKE